MTMLAEVLQPLDGAIPSSLVSSASLAAIAATVRALPSELTHHFGFECALNDPAPTADFALSMTPEEGEQALLGREALPADYLTHPVWSRIRQFGALWAERGSPLNGHVRNLYLEFDLRDASPSDVSVPSAFFAPYQGITRGQADDDGLSEPWVLDPAIPVLRGAALPLPTARALMGCVAALPAGAFVFQVGLMLARPVDAVRLCVRGLAFTDLPGLLGRVGWPGNWDEARAALAPYAALATDTALHLDVGSEVYPRIGLECYLGVPGGGDWSPTATAFLDSLVDAGLCVSAKRDGLLAWPGEQRVPADIVALPPNVSAKARLLSRAGFTMYRREMNHVKLSYTPGRPLEGKAYVGVVLGRRLGKVRTAPPLPVSQTDW
ncbi:MAG TPA: hypothetical protein VII06_12115 [Chloroflexota bacterium]|jgi:hypothetical protein